MRRRYEIEQHVARKQFGWESDFKTISFIEHRPGDVILSGPEARKVYSALHRLSQNAWAHSYVLEQEMAKEPLKRQGYESHKALWSDGQDALALLSESWSET